MTNILILTASIGNGHNQIASNLRNKLASSDCNVSVVDFLQASSYDVNNLVCNIYMKILQYKPDFFRSICHISENNKLNNIKYILAKINRRIIHKLVRKYQPDCIICTHFFPLAATAAYKEKYNADFELAAVVTDYSVHPMWQIDSVDRYFVAHCSMVEQFSGSFRAYDQVLPTGIPVGPDFIPADIYPDSNNILIMTSNQTEQSMSEIINMALHLPPEITVTFITGNDINRQKSLQKLAENHKNFTVIGYTKQVAYFMKKCGLIITKPGGSTISEAIAAGTPLVIVSPIPGMEEDNARFLEDNGLGFWVHTPEKLLEFTTSLLNDPAKRHTVRKKMLTLHMSEAADRIRDIILADLFRKNKVA